MDSARDLLSLKNPVPVQLVSDAHDIFATLQCSRPYQGADESLTSYMECLREDLLTGAVDEFLWVPPTSMLADGGSKAMDDKLAQALLRDGEPARHGSSRWRWLLVPESARACRLLLKQAALETI